MSYLQRHVSNPRVTPQSSPMSPEQVKNSADGYVFQVDCWTRLHRFLILGTESGTYYASERKATLKAVDAISECIATDGERTVAEIVGVSVAGLAHKQAPTLLALSMCASAKHIETRKAAYSAIPRVCRTATHLFMFLGFIKEQRGWSRGLRTAVASWYTRPWQEEFGAVETVAYQAVKYRQREGYTHRDAMRLSHPKARSPQMARLFGWITKPEADEVGELPPMVNGYELIQKARSAEKAAELVGEFGLPREAVPTEYVSSMEVQSALLDAGMPMTALVRNLGNLSKSGLLVVGSEAAKTVVNQLGDGERIRKARVHPIAILAALTVYKSGAGFRGSGTWRPVPAVVDALDAAFYTAFKNVEPTGKRYLLALDVSSSMNGHEINGIPGLDARTASGAMAMVTVGVEDHVETMAFQTEFQPLALSRRQRLDDVLRSISDLDFGGTDCSLPMLYAMGGGRDITDNMRRRYAGYRVSHQLSPAKPIEVDVFVVYTDNETWAGSIHPAQALAEYRKRVNPEAKLIVVGMCTNDFSIADPNDAGMMDIVGFSTDAPAVMNDFAR